MATQDDEFLKKLLATFRGEADEHLQAMSSGLLELEKTPAGARRSELVETIFREAHSLKGAARAVNLSHIESACQSLETTFAAMKDGGEPSGPHFDLLHQILDTLGQHLSNAPAHAGTGTLGTMIRQLERAPETPPPAHARPPSPIAPVDAPAPAASAVAESRSAARGAPSDTVRISIAKLDAAMRQAQELLPARLAAAERARELRELVDTLTARKKERAETRTVLRALQRTRQRSSNGNGRYDPEYEPRNLARLVAHQEGEHLVMDEIEERLSRLASASAADHRALTAMVDNLLEGVKAMQLMPLASLLETLPRIVRELARDRGKQAELTLRGGEIEIDRRILEELKDPLIHLLRNCVDHGIESPAERAQNGKPPHGTISIAISHTDSGKIELAVADDGMGVDAAKVKAAATRLGVISADEAAQLDAPEAMMLAFRSGLSTSPIITDLSGRGLGLAIVREKIERLGGAITLESRAGAGTTFRIVLPLTLATFRGILVRAAQRLFVLPASSVERVVRVAIENVQTVENRETVSIEGKSVSLVSLGDALELPRKTVAGEACKTIQAVVLGSGPARIAFQVDEVVGEQEVLVKTLGPQLARVRNVAGACVLGTGAVVPVLNVPDLMNSATKRAAAPGIAAAAGTPTDARKRRVLVVEDSITSRMLLKNILESAGYDVATAVDGIDGYTALKSATFDLVVSDVEMPRMDGFDLTAKIRADETLSELPIVLVTALEQREHRERGIDAGASAYIVKSSFEQSNLLEVVRRLIA